MFNLAQLKQNERLHTGSLLLRLFVYIINNKSMLYTYSITELNTSVCVN